MPERITFEPTGEVRCPIRGEWFTSLRGGPMKARFDFTEQRFPILTMRVEKEPTDE